MGHKITRAETQAMITDALDGASEEMTEDARRAKRERSESRKAGKRS